ncbi:penicillin acylase family protein [Rheinheimera mesophila]|uniref:Penicillin acylase family protein n=1 Tax=Rheinheimera mesophila TaxID=1547515 RepID=A0A3P3QTE4_9GAMM|nr:penicillin acylase family protein [Rheinheimera mesophila]KKL03284.1 penicillin amidase [Rheinheimera mesophila]RRJ23583.1 penicillin acylase family protein [Rheinheimera mesophila]
MLWFKRISIGLFSLILLVIGFLYFALRSSLPSYEGELPSEVSQTVEISRDAQGYVSIEGENRNDVAYALGFVHAQERFFQMDLLRRNAAGELSELFGEMAVELDKKRRIHRFRAKAERGFAALPPEQKALLQRYTAGVNAGLTELGWPPFEYGLLAQTPRNWVEVDSFLALYSMYLDLQGSEGKDELAMGLMQQKLPQDWYDFLFQHSPDWQAAMDDSTVSLIPMPKSAYPALLSGQKIACTECSLHDSTDVGSNNFAVSGKRTADGRAILADDMHLGIRVPGTWFKAQLKWQENAESFAVAGVSLPGTPAIVAGSNGHIAWGFTNSTADWSDVIALKLDEKGEKYQTADGWQEFSYQNEVIKVKGQPDELVLQKETIWGPVLSPPFQNYAYRWVAHDPQGANFNLLALEKSKGVKQTLKLAASAGVPTQNLLVADKDGAIGWTLIGALPQRKVQHMDSPQDWSNGQNNWTGYLPHTAYPQIYQPQSGQLWTANSRMIGGKDLELIGNGGYDLGARGQQIRDALSVSAHHNEQSLHAIQLDHRALMLARWQQLLLDTVLTKDFVAEHQLQSYRDYVMKDASQASIGSVGYSLVRAFRTKALELTFAPLTAVLEQNKLSGRDLKFSLETAGWEIIRQQRTDTLPAAFSSWRTLLQQAVLQSKQQLEKEHGSLAAANWGNLNQSAIAHPLSAAVPFFGDWLNMPAMPMNGDSHMPRVQNKVHGQSERMVVSPGKEAEGILVIPAGQSGHPLSPFYAADHDFWLKEQPLGFLPGEQKYLLKLQPKA